MVSWRQTDVGITLVVAQQHVVARLQRLDQLVFQQQRFGFGARDASTSMRAICASIAIVRGSLGLSEIAADALLECCRPCRRTAARRPRRTCDRRPATLLRLRTKALPSKGACCGVCVVTGSLSGAAASFPNRDMLNRAGFRVHADRVRVGIGDPHRAGAHREAVGPCNGCGSMCVVMLAAAQAQAAQRSLPVDDPQQRRVGVERDRLGFLQLRYVAGPSTCPRARASRPIKV